VSALSSVGGSVAGDFNGDGRWDIAAIGAGVDGHSIDLLVLLGDGSGGFGPIANWRHADGFGWSGMKPVAGDFNGDRRWDIAPGFGWGGLIAVTL
jgi:VCBS repeat protein